MHLCNLIYSLLILIPYINTPSSLDLNDITALAIIVYTVKPRGSPNLKQRCESL